MTLSSPSTPPVLPDERILVDPRERNWSAKPTFLLIYPHTYQVGMSNLGFQFLLREMLQQRDETFDRAFLSSAHGDSLFPPVTRRRSPRSLCLGLPLAAFAVHLVSVSFESDQLNLLRGLRDAGLPLRPTERNDRHPIIVAGGAGLGCNPFVALSWADAVTVGDGEPLLGPLCDQLALFARGAQRRASTLTALQGIPGVICRDDLGKKESWSRPLVGDLDRQPASTVLLGKPTVFSDCVLCEMTRGCRQGCRFCLVGSGHGPVRYLGRMAFRSLLQQMPWEPSWQIGLVGASLADHPELGGICRDLNRQGRGFTTSSLRLDRLASEDLALLAKGGSRTLTFAPEAGSERLRRAIGKPLGTDRLLDALAHLARGVQTEIKLYFMVGLPGETAGDIEAIAELLTLAQKIFRQAGRAAALKVGVAPFVPKPGTPFQWAPQAGVKELEAKLRGLRKVAGRLGLRMTTESARAAQVEALLAMGDLELGNKLVDFVASEERNPGASAFRRAMGDREGPLGQLGREKTADHCFPWDRLESETGKNRLRQRYEQGRDILS